MEEALLLHEGPVRGGEARREEHEEAQEAHLHRELVWASALDLAHRIGRVTTTR